MIAPYSKVTGGKKMSGKTWGLLLSLFFTAHIFAGPSANLNLINAPTTGEPGKFAAAEIRREAEVKGMAMSESANATRITLSVQKDDKTSAQSYSIRVQNEGGRRTITVRGADAAGAMYGGLDVAAAIRTGAPDSLKDSDHTPQLH